MYERADFELGFVAGLEVAVFGRQANAGGPVVFFTHGLKGSLQTCFNHCRAAAQRGMIAIGIEQRNHGRRILDVRRNLRQNHHGFYTDLFGICVGTASDVRTIIDLLESGLGIATARIGMSGTSLGGYTTLMAMSMDPRIRVGAPIVGMADLRHVAAETALLEGLDEQDVDDAFPEPLASVMQRFEPSLRPEQFSDRPLILINGEHDTVVTPDANRAFYNRLKPHYTQPERLKLLIEPDADHCVTPTMLDAAMDWLQRWL
jgi:alpha-beta hydrolase superfamily lysophospholipase